MTTYLGKSCSFGLPRVPFVNCHQFMYLVISLMVLRAGYGIWLYQFLIIAYLFTLLGFSFIEPPHEIMVLITLATNDSSGEPRQSLRCSKYGSSKGSKTRHLAPLDGCAGAFEE